MILTIDGIINCGYVPKQAKDAIQEGSWMDSANDRYNNSGGI